MIEKTMQIDRMENVISVFGSFDQNLHIIETELGVTDDEIAALRDRYLEAEAAQPSQPVTVPGRPEAERGWSP